MLMLRERDKLWENELNSLLLIYKIFKRKQYNLRWIFWTFCGWRFRRENRPEGGVVKTVIVINIHLKKGNKKFKSPIIKIQTKMQILHQQCIVLKFKGLLKVPLIEVPKSAKYYDTKS
jgi:hypothetical protein